VAASGTPGIIVDGATGVSPQASTLVMPAVLAIATIATKNTPIKIRMKNVTLRDCVIIHLIGCL